MIFVKHTEVCVICTYVNVQYTFQENYLNVHIFRFSAAWLQYQTNNGQKQSGVYQHFKWNSVQRLFV